MLQRLAIFGILLGSTAGCLHFEHPTPDIRPEEWLPCDELPLESKSSVYVFVFDSFDPLQYCNTQGIREYLIGVGFTKVFYGNHSHRGYFLEKMRLIHEHCPSARFTVIGYENGVEAARQFCMRARECGIEVDLLVSLEPKLCTTPAEGLAFRSISIFGNSCQAECGTLSDEEVFYLERVNSNAVPTHPRTLELIVRELTVIGMGVPIVAPREFPDEGLIKPLPAPRKVKAEPKSLPASWDFLKPKAQPVDPKPLEVVPADPLPVPLEIQE